MTEPLHLPAPGRVPVLVVGAGPAGLTTAIALARHGVRCLLVDRRADPSGLPRATSVSTRSMELLRALGLEEEVRAGAVEVDWAGWACETLATAAAGSPFPTGYPSREQSAVLSPTAPACVPQDHLEPVLLEHLRSLGPARVELGTEVVACDVGPDEARVVLRDVATGASREVRAAFVVGADGARSTVREALGIAMRGPDRLEEAVTALFRAPLWEVVGERRHGIYDIAHPDAAGVLLPGGRGDRWMYGTRRERLEGDVEARLARRIALASGVAGLEPRIERVGSFAFAAQLADRFRHGRAFLAGDSAHRVTPRGGTGMNTAIHSGFDLGWKLAWVLRGWAGPGLLDTYEAERRPVAEHNVRRSADPEGTVRGAGEALRADLGGRIAHVPLPGGASTLDLLGPGLTLLCGPRRAAWDVAAAAVPGPLPLAVRGLDAMAARALGVPDGGALLARPDGVPAGWWGDGTDAVRALHAAVGALTARGHRLHAAA
jgi:2-polyprenyl-6-methoxyphenol hydroxylase-like FAD-dependent oxidoreductase